LHGHDSELGAMAFSADSKQLVSLSSDIGARIWSLESTSIPAQLHDQGNVLTAAFAGSRDLLSAGLGKNGVCLRQLPSRTCGTRLPSRADQVRSLAVSPDHKLLAQAGSDGQIVIWDLAAKLPLAVFQAHQGEVRAVAFSSDSAWLASGGTDGQVRLWGMPTATLSMTFDARSGVNALAFRPLSNELVSAGRDGRLRFWDIASRRGTGELKAHDDWLFAVAFSEDGAWLAAASGDRSVSVWDAKTRSKRRALRGHEGRVFALAFSRSGDWLASSGEDSNVRIHNYKSGRELAILRGHEGAVRTLQLAPEGSLLASAGDDGTIRLWQLSRLAQPALDLLRQAEARHLVRVEGTQLRFGKRR
jgi:WD40 repeat protein